MRSPAKTDAALAIQSTPAKRADGCLFQRWTELCVFIFWTTFAEKAAMDCGDCIRCATSIVVTQKHAIFGQNKRGARCRVHTRLRGFPVLRNERNKLGVRQRQHLLSLKHSAATLTPANRAVKRRGGFSAAIQCIPKLSVAERGVDAASTHELGRRLDIPRASGFRTLKRGEPRAPGRTNNLGMHCAAIQSDCDRSRSLRPALVICDGCRTESGLSNPSP